MSSEVDNIEDESYSRRNKKKISRTSQTAKMSCQFYNIYETLYHFNLWRNQLNYFNLKSFQNKFFFKNDCHKKNDYIRCIKYGNGTHFVKK